MTLWSDCVLSVWAGQNLKMFLLLMGVCGSGKTTVGQQLAAKLNLSFADADEFHSQENKQKMSSGQPLTDQDRLPWLHSIHNYIVSQSAKNQSGVVTCSALTKFYRNILRFGSEGVNMKHDQKFSRNSGLKTSSNGLEIMFVHLTGSEEILQNRMASRLGHFMPATLLQSQLHTLERLEGDEPGIEMDIDRETDEIVADIIDKVHLEKS